MWKHSVTAALAAQLIAEDQRDDASSAFTAALLHEAGKLILAELYGDVYGLMLTQCAERPHALAAEEQGLFQVDHADVGGRLLTRWKFPQNLSASVAFQHRPAEAGDAQRLAAYVHLGDALAHLVDKPQAGENAYTPSTKDALNILHLPPEAINRYRDRTMENFEFVNALCRL